MIESAVRAQPLIAIVGMSTLFPGRATVEGFWRDIVEGADLIREVPSTHWPLSEYYDPDPHTSADKTYCRSGSFISAVPFDPLEYGIPPTVLKHTDSAQLLTLVAAKRLLEEIVFHRGAEFDRSRTSVILGAGESTVLQGLMAARTARAHWECVLRQRGMSESEIDATCDAIVAAFPPWDEMTLPGALTNVIAGRITNRLDLGGTNITVDAACASSLAAVSMAVNELELGLCDLAITGGVDVHSTPGTYISFCKTPALSLTSDCRPFSEAADGTVLGEGIGLFALRRLEDAERDGDPIYAVIRGVGTSSDGSGASIYAPNQDGQVAALRRAYERAGYAPETVALIEAHGTGTAVGDVVEVASLREVFEGAEDGRGTPEQKVHALGSIKSQIGHTKCAAGAAGLFKTTMALRNKVLPPTLKVNRPNPRLGIEHGSFYLNTEARPWIAPASKPRRAAVSAFGFGGTNVHVTLEEYLGPGRAFARCRPSPTELVLASSDSPEDLAIRIGGLLRARTEGLSLAAMARESQQSFDAEARCRLAVIAPNGDDLAAKLDHVSAALGQDPSRDTLDAPGIHYRSGPSAPGPLAYLFPGQGSQYVGMGADLAMAFDVARDVWDREAEGAFGAPPLHEIVFPTPALSDTERRAQAALLAAVATAQPALAAAELAQLAVLDCIGLRPDMTAGHSFGEVLALHAAGAFDRDTTLAIARRRGELMAAAAADSPGAMIAVSLGLDEAEALLEEWGSTLVVANCNAPRQVVLSGSLEAIELAEARLKDMSLAARRLEVAAAFHSSLVGASAAPFRRYLESASIEPPSLPVFTNTSAERYSTDPGALAATLAEQLAGSVRFRQMIEAMYSAGARLFLEVGPGDALTRLVGQCLAGRPHGAIALDRRSTHGLTSLWEALGQLASLGFAIDFKPLWADLQVADATPDPKSLKPHVLWVDSRPVFRPPAGSFGLAKGEVSPAMAAAGSPAAEAPGQRPGALPPPAAKTAPVPATALDRTAADAILAEAAATQELYLRTMADNHRAYLDLVGRAMTALGDEPTRFVPPAVSAPRESAPPPVVPALLGAEAIAMPDGEMPSPEEFERILIEVIAERTGYPPELLEPDMEIEADLGIDSLKRLEIYMALQERFPGLPRVEEMDMAEAGGLRTIREIVEFVRTEIGSRRIDNPVVTPSDSRPHLVAEIEGPDLQSRLVDLVARQTGYPHDLISLDADLEHEMGLDATKLAELVEMLRKDWPVPVRPIPGGALPEDVRTLQQLAEFLDRDRMQAAPARKKTEVAPPVGVECVIGPALTRCVVVAEAAAPRSGSLFSPLPPGPIVVMPSKSALTPAIVEQLRLDGISAIAADVAPEDCAGLIHLGGLCPETGPEQSLAVQRAAFLAAKAIAPRFSEFGGLFVIVQDTGGDFGLSGAAGERAWLGGLAGLAKTAGKCWPKAVTKAIDIECGDLDPDSLAERIVAELTEAGPETEIGIRASGARITPVAGRRERQRTDAFPFDETSVVVLSGGARGITAECAVELARTCHPRMVLLGRTTLTEEPDYCRDAVSEPDLKRVLLDAIGSAERRSSLAQAQKETARILAVREVRATLTRLETLGSKATYLPVDVCDRVALAAALDPIRCAWGPFTGLVHGAGQLADKLIRDKTVAQFERVFRTKVIGLANLLAVMDDDPLRLVCLFSSIVARTGNVGQVDYVMANEVLNKVAQVEARRRGGDCLVRSVNWGPWAGGMVTETMSRLFKAAGQELIQPAAGAAFFVEELRESAAGPVEILVSAGSDFLSFLSKAPAPTRRLAASAGA